MSGEHFMWQVKPSEGGCHACGSPDCMYMKPKHIIDTIISNLRALEDLGAKERRHMAYKMTIEIGYGKFETERSWGGVWKTSQEIHSPVKVTQDSEILATGIIPVRVLAANRPLSYCQINVLLCRDS